MRTPTSGLHERRVRAAALIVSGVVLLAYPLLRGHAVEDGRAAAELYARPAWLWAHVLAMLGFVLVSWSFAAVDRTAHRAAVVGTTLLLPYYGAEAYGLHAIGRRVLETGDDAILATTTGAADSFRFEPVAMTLFALGWCALLVAAVRLAVLAARSRGTARAGLTLTAAALATYLPQFFLPEPGRVAHGAVAATGLVLLALALWRTGAPGAMDDARRAASASPTLA